MSLEGAGVAYAPITLRGLGAGEVRGVGIALGRELAGGTTVALYGRLGAGKTTMIQAICEGLGVAGPVTSPTFTIVNEYRGRYRVHHVDLYRLGEVEDLREIGLEEMAHDGAVCLVEWAEKASGYLQTPRLDIEIAWVSDERRDVGFSFRGDGVWKRVHRMLRESGGGGE